VRLIAADSLGWDVALMRQEMARARTSQAAGAADALVDHARAAFALYQGPFLPDPAWYEPFLYERQELERQHDAFAEWLGEVLGPLDPRLPGLLGEAIRGNPGEVALHRLRIQSLMAQGRVADARRALDACAAALQALVGVPPPPELVRLVEHAPDAPSGG
jgi:DNA-binding SARP family transcriptional activator